MMKFCILNLKKLTLDYKVISVQLPGKTRISCSNILLIVWENLSLLHITDLVVTSRIISTDGIVEIKAPVNVCDPSDLFSSSAGLTERSSDSWLESDDLPFGIYPEKGVLPPGESIECTLRFSPMDVFDYKANLTCKCDNYCDCVDLTSRSI